MQPRKKVSILAVKMGTGTHGESSGGMQPLHPCSAIERVSVYILAGSIFSTSPRVRTDLLSVLINRETFKRQVASWSIMRLYRTRKVKW